jgi:hypothetical protein
MPKNIFYFKDRISYINIWRCFTNKTDCNQLYAKFYYCTWSHFSQDLWTASLIRMFLCLIIQLYNTFCDGQRCRAEIDIGSIRINRREQRVIRRTNPHFSCTATCTPTIRMKMWVFHKYYMNNREVLTRGKPFVQDYRRDAYFLMSTTISIFSRILVWLTRSLQVVRTFRGQDGSQSCTQLKQNIDHN